MIEFKLLTFEILLFPYLTLSKNTRRSSLLTSLLLSLVISHNSYQTYKLIIEIPFNGGKRELFFCLTHADTPSVCYTPKSFGLVCGGSI